MLVFSILSPKDGPSSQKKSTDKNSEAPCFFCGYLSKNNRRQEGESPPLNHDKDPLTVVDPLCEAWQNLDSLKMDEGFVAYLPEMKPEDVNHLQRAAFFALQSPDPVYREAGKAVMNWLAEHKKEVEAYWGTSQPKAFAQALQKASEEQRAQYQHRWRHLALILPPKKFIGNGFFAEQGLESDTTRWAQIYQGFLRHDLLCQERKEAVNVHSDTLSTKFTQNPNCLPLSKNKGAL